MQQIGSYKLFRTAADCAPSATFTPPDSCCGLGGQTFAVAPAATFDLSTLGLVPPFHVEGP
jgi:hypothetical protein